MAWVSAGLGASATLCAYRFRNQLARPACVGSHSYYRNLDMDTRPAQSRSSSSSSSRNGTCCYYTARVQSGMDGIPYLLQPCAFDGRSWPTGNRFRAPSNAGARR
ncbi:uncharacterized protein K460DRAFT_172282 [Cucurbitaria berberidis CBS 394.84]|uniref:Uncharacterized protein n=1 Tax=Cucurbitaria berberidis CBS 394.84 TaxID=1168544 RepID=A0A9P4L590_9PLEO|nr:uncharacterized protein K460DRAFT_172282 [Cucurbitaria berberidis CBS 394.84]KAF1841733.1 hypothetical protein K460DRAFT_172282 [Cucurbitaria berberidis CBS 394.84]